MEGGEGGRSLKVVALSPHGFCAGVTAALRKALSLRGVYCLHELVHNELVVADLRARGFRFVERVEEVPIGETVLFSAHGVAPAVRVAAAARKLRIVDATCPFVERVHRSARAFAARGLPVVVIGNPGHAEVRGIVGELAHAYVYPDLPPPGPIGVVSQTTMNADEVAAIVARLKERHSVETAAEVCNATKDRQDAVKAFDGDALLVLGSANSSNTRRLGEVARCRVLRAGSMDEVKALDLAGVRTLGVTSGASTPESFFREAVGWLEGRS